VALARSLRIFLALALLCAQQAALSHQVWHAGKQSAPPPQEQLCDQHQALDTVAGAVDAPVAALDAEAPAASAFSFSAPAPVATPAPAPSSRGPPSFL
jgi:hypothetical protein